MEAFTIIALVSKRVLCPEVETLALIVSKSAAAGKKANVSLAIQITDWLTPFYVAHHALTRQSGKRRAPFLYMA